MRFRHTAAPHGLAATAQAPAGEAEKGFARASHLREEKIRDTARLRRHRIARRGWHLHSGGAAGADSAFAAGAPADRRTIFLPWPGYRRSAGADCRTLAPDRMRTCVAIAAALHPAWHRCSPAARNLHARNTAILLGEGADTPVHAVVAFTSRGLVSGGTGQGIRIARDRGIPVLNLGAMHPRAVCERLEQIRAAALPAVPSG